MSDDVEEGFKQSSIVEKASLLNPLTAPAGSLAIGARASTHRTLRKAGLLDDPTLTPSKTPEEIRRESVAAGIQKSRQQSQQRPGRKQTVLMRSQPRRSILG